MKSEAVLKYWIAQDEVLPVDAFLEKYDFSVPAVYEVIRLMGGIPLFLEEHLDRMQHSLQMLGKESHTLQRDIAGMIKRLVAVNGENDFNIKIVVLIKENLLECNAFFIETFYPDEKMYQDGVPTGTIEMMRDNPNAKVMNYSFKQAVRDEMVKRKLYELLLVNEHKEITEGSRSNVFFVAGNDVITPPAGQVLKGVTRRHIFSVCAGRKIKILEEAVRTSDLRSMDAVFLTGTSPKVLPVAAIDDCIFASPSNAVVRQVMQGYDAEIRAYLASHTGGFGSGGEVLRG